jgi:hypothetical protein
MVAAVHKRYSLPARYYDKNKRGWCFPGWVFLHAIADSFPLKPSLERQNAAREFFTRELPLLLPCDPCGKHTAEEIIRNNIDVSSGPNLSIWLYKFHNAERARRGMPPFTMEQCKIDQEFYRSINWAALMEDLEAACNFMSGAQGSSNALDTVTAGKNPFLDSIRCVTTSTPGEPRQVRLNDDHDDGTTSNSTIDVTASSNSSSHSAEVNRYKMIALILGLLVVALSALSIYLLSRNRSIGKTYAPSVGKGVTRQTNHQSNSHLQASGYRGEPIASDCYRK